MLRISHAKYVISIILLSIILLEFIVKSFAADHDGGTKTGHSKPKILRYQIAAVNFKHVENAFMISIWMLLASLAKLGFYLSPKPSSYVPESCMLLLLGVVTGLVLFYSKIQGINYTISTSLFFLFLLPPIVLDAGYFMPLRPFFENIGTILLLAVVGTLWNTLAMGFSLWGIIRTGIIGVDVPLMHCLLFSSLISAVDPVAILSVFEEANVNEVLHIIVFGESLLNDGVAIVLYNMFGSFSEIGLENIITRDIVFGVISFGVVAFGGTLIGILFGLFTGWLTKYTDKIRIIEPLFVFLLAYLSYIVADMFTLSGILAIVFCGLIMRQFVEANIALKSNITVKYTMKTLSSICESIIFLFLGLSTVVDIHIWNTAFTLFTLFFCLFYRAIGILVLIPFINRYRLAKLSKVDIFIMIYGGLRGAISFSLALLLNEDVLGQQNKRMFVTTTMTVVIFTSFFQGLTIRPLVEFLRVKKAQEKDRNMATILFDRCMDHLLAGAEDIIGGQGKNRLREKLEFLQYKYLQPYLVKKLSSRDDNLVDICKKLNVYEAKNLLNQYHGDIIMLKEEITGIRKDQRKSIDLPVLDTSHMDEAYANRIASKWHDAVDNLMPKRRTANLKRFSRQDIYDDPVNLPSLVNRYSNTNYKQHHPIIEKQYKDSNKLVRLGSGITNTLRRYSNKITNAFLPKFRSDSLKNSPKIIEGIPNPSNSMPDLSDLKSQTVTT
ncbi:Na(+)/H(+) exchanger protein 2-like [Gordionus sp. m RMFG-2023]|uniref:Na(+)/H(+) exchanger protein 2-like n=1 Tax=Gordionus sp. m RMFG-2023 TaxID=3053472 RepID=UPI0031FD0505